MNSIQSISNQFIATLIEATVKVRRKEGDIKIVNLTDKNKQLFAIGSGGNINKIFRLSHKKEGKPLTYKQVKMIYDELKSYSYEERIRIMELRPDRADVIIPASEIYLSVMKWTGIKEIYVPQVGLADGLIHILYEKHKKSLISKN